MWIELPTNPRWQNSTYAGFEIYFAWLIPGMVESSESCRWSGGLGPKEWFLSRLSSAFFPALPVRVAVTSASGQEPSQVVRVGGQGWESAMSMAMKWQQDQEGRLRRGSIGNRGPGHRSLSHARPLNMTLAAISKEYHKFGFKF